MGAETQVYVPAPVVTGPQTDFLRRQHEGADQANEFTHTSAALNSGGGAMGEGTVPFRFAQVSIFSPNSTQLQSKPNATGTDEHQEQQAEETEEHQRTEAPPVGDAPAVVQAQMLQRQAEATAGEAGPDLEARLAGRAGGGAPLSTDVRSYMEPRFGFNFSQVRVHTDDESVQMNRQLNAQAFAHGSNIYFGAGKSPADRHLLAHELTHVVQQTGGVKFKLTVGAPNDRYEQEADRVADQVLSMAPPAPTNVQRQTEEEQEEVQTKPLVESITPIVQHQEGLEGEEEIQAKCESCEGEEQVQRSPDGVPQVQPNLESRLNASKGGGSPLPDEVRSFMEPRFGADFSQVRLHTGSESVQMNRDLNAQAFTYQQEVYFGSGKSPANDAWTAHELTHVVQQVSPATNYPQRSSLTVQRQPTTAAKPAGQSPKQRIIEALNIPDPVGGVGDYAEAFKILNSLPMYDILNTLTGLKSSGHFDILNDNLNQAVGVNLPRLRVAFKAVLSNGSVTAESFTTQQETLLSTLPSDQRTDIAKFLDPQWVALLAIEDFPSASDKQLGAEYGRALTGDPARLEAVENEIEKRDDKSSGIGFGPLTGGSASTPGTTAVTPDIALKILENLSKGEPPFRPESGKGGASWFVTKGSPYVGIDAAKNVDIQVEIKNLKDAIVFTEKELLVLFEEELQKPELKESVEARFRMEHEIPADKPLTPRMQKQINRKNGLLERAAETRMWDKVGEQVAKSPGKVGRVILQNSRFSKHAGDGEFAVVSDPAKIQIKGGPTKLLETVKKAGIEADPVVVEAAQALAKKMKWAGRVRNVFRYGGRIMIVVAIAADVYKIYKAEDRVKTTIESVGGWAGATAAGAAFAALWAPADVAGPVAWAVHGVGTLVAGGIGYWVGSEVTRTIYELIVEE
jgi:hypothetical protein